MINFLLFKLELFSTYSTVYTTWAKPLSNDTAIFVLNVEVRLVK